MNRNAALLLIALLLPAGCTPAVDDRLRRIDLLDRVFEPERFRPPPSEPPAISALVAEPIAPMDEPPMDLVAEPAPTPQADPALRRQALLRQQPWLSRFWSALTPAQQQRVRRRLPDAAEPATAWDSMGLADRVTLVFGAGG